MSIGGSSGSSQTQLDPQIKSDWQGVFDTAKNTAAQVPIMHDVAGLDPNQIQGVRTMVANAPQGESTINSGVDKLAGLSTSTYAPNVTGQLMQQPGDVTAQAFPGSNLSGYVNPFSNDVANTTLGQLDLARKMAINGNSSDATLNGGEGAWGGARAGVSDALTNESFGRTAASTLANLNQTGFDTAAGLQQADAARALQAAQGNQGVAFNTASTNAGNNQQAELAQAGFNNDAVNRQLAAVQSLVQAAPVQQGIFDQAGQTQFNAGQLNQQQVQKDYDNAAQNALQARNLPLQTLESAFGIVPNTGSGSVTHSTGKSGQT